MLVKTVVTLAAGLAVALVAFAGAATTSIDKAAGKKTPASSSAKSHKKAASSNSTVASKGVASKPGSTKTGSTKTGSTRSVAASTKASKKTGTSRKPAKSASAVYRHSAQQQPSAERYKEIQQALSDKGYFGGTVDGTWGPESVDALKRFQRDQNLTDDGKIGSLSLIALGLGPKHDGIDLKRDNEAGSAAAPASDPDLDRTAAP